MIMGKDEKTQFIRNVCELLTEMIHTPDEIAEKEKVPSNDKVEMLTVKECSELMSGVAVSTIYKMVRKEKLPCARVGVGETGRILIPKSAVLRYLHEITND